MKTEYKWIRFEEQLNLNKKTSRWYCINTSNDFLGEVHWHCGFRQYSFEPDSDFNSVVFSAGCLRDIADFLEQLNIKQKEKRK